MTPRWPPMRQTLTGVGIAVAIVAWVTFQSAGNAVDALCYWLAAHRPQMYVHGDFEYVYSPAAAQIAWPLLSLPFEAFAGIMRAAELAAVVVMAGPVTGLALFLPPVATEINAANINLLLVLAIAGSFRWPALWAAVLLTKPTMGIGLLWYVARGEWRNLATALGVTAAIAGISFVLTPHLWFDYVGQLFATFPVPGWPFPIPIWVRLPLVVPLAIWAARTGRPRALMLASMLALPRLYFQSPAMLLGLLIHVDLAKVRQPSHLGEAARKLLERVTVASRARPANGGPA